MNREINRYVLLEQIGSGGMSKVWRARRKDTEENLAIKVIPIEDINPDFERRLRREPEIHQQLQHENIVSLYDWFREGDEFFIVMEYIQGRPLSALIRERGPVPFETARTIFRDVLRAVHHLHENQVVHRDIKPGNILIDLDGRAKLTDFGIAKFGWQQGETRTQLGLGTPEYMSPEQVRGSGIDYRTDIWSLGITLFEMLSGKKPFARGEETPAHYAEVISNIMNSDLPDPRQFNPSIPDGALAIIGKATARRPEDRYQSVAEFLGALEVVDPTKITPYSDPDVTVVGGVNDRVAISAGTGVGMAPVMNEVRSEPQQVYRTEEEDRRGKRGLVVVLVLLFLAAAAYGGYLYYQRQLEENQKPLTKQMATDLAREIAAEFKRYSFDGNVDALAGLYADSGVLYYRLKNVGRKEIAADYGKLFEHIIRTDRVDVEAGRVQVVNDSTFTTQWIATFERLRDDGYILRSEEVHDVTITRIDGDWLIKKIRLKSIKRNNEAPPVVDTTTVDTTDVTQDPEVPDPPVEETPKAPTEAQIKNGVKAIVTLINNGNGSQAWAQYASDELKSSMGGFPELMSVGSLRIGNIAVNGTSATVTFVQSEGFAQQEYTVNMSFAGNPELKVTSLSLAQ